MQPFIIIINTKVISRSVVDKCTQKCEAFFSATRSSGMTDRIFQIEL